MKSVMYYVLIPALLPVFLVLWYVYRKDKMEREPLGQVLKVLFLGAIFSIPCAAAEEMAFSVLENMSFQTALSFAFTENVFGVALIEEFAKWMVLMLFIWNNRNFDYRYDGVVYAVASSLGFAALENILYIMNYGSGISLGRAIFSIPGHATFGIFMGSYLARAKAVRVRGKYMAKFTLLLMSLAIPTLIHGIYDFLLSTPVSDNGYEWTFYIYVLCLDVVSWLRIRREFKHDTPITA